jgi:hypothetical protein
MKISNKIAMALVAVVMSVGAVMSGEVQRANRVYPMSDETWIVIAKASRVINSPSIMLEQMYRFRERIQARMQELLAELAPLQHPIHTRELRMVANHDTDPNAPLAQSVNHADDELIEDNREIGDELTAKRLAFRLLTRWLPANRETRDHLKRKHRAFRHNTKKLELRLRANELEGNDELVAQMQRELRSKPQEYAESIYQSVPERTRSQIPDPGAVLRAMSEFICDDDTMWTLMELSEYRERCRNGGGEQWQNELAALDSVLSKLDALVPAEEEVEEDIGW